MVVSFEKAASRISFRIYLMRDFHRKSKGSSLSKLVSCPALALSPSRRWGLGMRLLQTEVCMLNIVSVVTLEVCKFVITPTFSFVATIHAVQL